MAKLKVIPDRIANGCPAKCPCCNRRCVAVFRTWKPNGNVSCIFLHLKDKNCKRTYKNNLSKTIINEK